MYCACCKGHSNVAYVEWSSQASDSLYLVVLHLQDRSDESRSSAARTMERSTRMSVLASVYHGRYVKWWCAVYVRGRLNVLPTRLPLSCCQPSLLTAEERRASYWRVDATARLSRPVWQHAIKLGLEGRDLCFSSAPANVTTDLHKLLCSH